MGTQIVIGSNGSVVVSTVASITSSSEIRCLGLRNLQFNAVFSSPVLFQFYLITSSPFPFLGSFKFFYNSNNRSDEHYYLRWEGNPRSSEIVGFISSGCS